MNRFNRVSKIAAALCIVSALLLLAPGARAQQRGRTPHVGYVYPAGGKQGTTVEVTIGGQLLNGVSQAAISGDGITASFLTYTKPLTQGQAGALRDKLAEARKTLMADPKSAASFKRGRPLENMLIVAKAAGVTESELKMLDDFNKERNDKKRQPNPQLEEKVTLALKIAPGAAPGFRELRLLTVQGLTNPLRFQVGQIPEVRETEPNDSNPDPCITSLPAVVNGQIMPGDVDRFAFSATKGQRLTVAVAARELMPYLADAVPGWFQPALAIYDAKGHELARADHFHQNPDPALLFNVPETGSFVLEIHDSIYRGREDFVYRVNIGELPFITGIFPLGGRDGAKTKVQLTGWNLPQQSVDVDASGSGQCPVFVTRDGIVSNRLCFAIDTLPECMQASPSQPAPRRVRGRYRKAAPAAPVGQSVTLPILVNGRIHHPGEAHVFRFAGQAGNTVVAEVLARRLGSPLDSVLELTDSAGKRIALNDDFEDKSAGLVTHQADSRISVKLPHTGVYLLRLWDAQKQYGPEYGYRLRISPPRPDFELRVVPSCITGRPGSTVPVNVQVIRKDDYNGEIALELQNAPPGFELRGGVIPAGKTEVNANLVLPPTRGPEILALQMTGRCLANGHEVRRPVLAADDMMQAFFYHHLVTAQDWRIAVGARPKPIFAPVILPTRKQAVKKAAAAAAAVKPAPNAPAAVVKPAPIAPARPPIAKPVRPTTATSARPTIATPLPGSRAAPGGTRRPGITTTAPPKPSSVPAPSPAKPVSPTTAAPSTALTAG